MYTKIILLASLVVFASCQKKAELPTLEELGYWGTCTSLINGKEWSGAPIAVFSEGKGFQIGIDSLDKYFIHRAALNFNKVPITPGTSRLSDTFFQTNDSLTGSHYFVVDDDVSLGNYKILESDNSSFITLDSYDSVSKEIKGTFEITFIVDHRPDPSYPDTLRFRNGKFHTRLKE